VGEPDALWVNVKSPVVRPIIVGAYVISNIWLPPGIIVIGNAVGVNVNCPSSDDMLDITRSEVPGLFTVACNVEFEPITTEPKSRFGGVIVKVASTPVPCTEYTVGEPDALWVNVKSPVVRPIIVGAYVISNIWLPPGIIVIGNAVGVNVNCPSSDDMLDITRSEVPGLFTVACNVEFEPITTEPKSRFGGVIVKVASTPVPCTEYTVGEPDALWVNVKSPVVRPIIVGAYVISNIWLPPGIIVIGNAVGVNVNCPSSDDMLDITRSEVPGLFTVA